MKASLDKARITNQDQALRQAAGYAIRETCAADGCTLNTTALPAATMPIALQRIVSVGFVVGVIAKITPYGARSVSIKP